MDDEYECYIMRRNDKVRKIVKISAKDVYRVLELIEYNNPGHVALVIRTNNKIVWTYYEEFGSIMKFV